MSQNLKVINQWLRDFTVQIRTPKGDIIGTGVAVSADGKIVTCAHVVKAAIGKHPRQADGAEVGVYFPQARGSEQERRARVAECFPHHDDDVVLLQLVDGPAPLGIEQIATLGTCDDSDGNRFQSYGYRRREKYQAGYAQGTIMGLIPSPDGETWQGEVIELESPQLNRGMSGAAVLDVERNLVVGIVSQVWTASGKDRDAAFGVNAHVLSLEPLNLPMYAGEEPYPRKAATQPRQPAPEDAQPASGFELSRAPDPLDEWVGRTELLRELMKDYNDPNCKVVGLIGFGGEGKTSLARQWVAYLAGEILPPDGAQSLAPLQKPEGIFWWSFYERRSSDEFFEAALTYVGGIEIAKRATSAANRADIIAALLKERRYVLVLDGFEVMQDEDGDKYGSASNQDLRRFLTLLAGDHGSFAIITSRAPLMDVVNYTTYRQHDVTRLSREDGRALLREVGVAGRDGDLEKVVESWDGHALTLSLIGSYLKDRYAGDVGHIGEIPSPTADEDRYQRVHRVLRRYDEHLDDAERAFLKLFSAFRLPVKESAFGRVFRTATDATSLNAPLTPLDDRAFNTLVAGLVIRRMIRQTMVESEEAGAEELAYTAHPLLRAHYSALLANESGATKTHQDIAEYYQSIAKQEMPRFPTMDDLAPYMEVVHHLCRAGAYDEAHEIRKERITQNDRFVLTRQLGAYETDLVLMLEFFPDGDLTGEPGVSQSHAKGFILNSVGLCLMNLGRLGEAAPFYERGNAVAADLENWRNASVGYRNVADLYASLGNLQQSAAAAREALARAGRVEDEKMRNQDECDSLTYLAWAAHLTSPAPQTMRAQSLPPLQPETSQEENETPGVLFARAEALQRENEPQTQYLYSLRGIRHTDYLRRTGQADYARRVMEANLEICERYSVQNQISQCHYVLGDLDADDGDHNRARDHYDEALRIARGIQRRDVLIVALLARGRWYAKHIHEVNTAFSDLNEALDYATSSGYQIYEANIRVALGWAHLANGDKDKAQAEAVRAKTMSQEMGYHWGQVDADEVLAKLG